MVVFITTLVTPAFAVHIEGVGDDHSCRNLEENPVITSVTPTVDGAVITWTQDPIIAGDGGHHLCLEPESFTVDSFTFTQQPSTSPETIVGLSCETQYLVTVITTWEELIFEDDDDDEVIYGHEDTSASTLYTTLACPDIIDPIVVGSTINITEDGETIQTATDEYTEFCVATDETSPANPVCSVQSGGINTNVLGEQTVTYEATDDAGNVGTVTVTTTIVALTCDEGYEVVNYVCELIILDCDFGYEQIGIECVLIILDCDLGYEQIETECVLIPIDCDFGYEQIETECVLIILDCDFGYEQIETECVLIILDCDLGYEQIETECVLIILDCDLGYEQIETECVLIPLNCDQGYEQIETECVLIPIECQEGYEQVETECVLIILDCPDGQEQSGIECVWIPIDCDNGYEQFEDQCVLTILECPDGQEQSGIECVWIPIECDEGFEQIEDRCELIILECPDEQEQIGIECVWIPCEEGFERNTETNLCESGNHGSTCHVPPTFGTPYTCAVRNFVDDGVVIHGVSFDPEMELHIKNPQINAVVGLPYSIQLSPYENEGQYSIKWVGISLGLVEGDFIFGNGQALAYLHQSHDGTFTVEEDDPTDIIEIGSFAKVGEKQCAIEDNDSMCPIYELKYKYREAPIGNMIGVQVVNIGGESENRFFNDGIDVTGNSMNPSPVIEVLADEKFIASHYLTFVDPSFKDRTVAVDENGKTWNKVGNFWSTDHLMPNRECDVTSFGFSRTCPEFSTQMQGQELLALYTLNEMYPNINRDEPFNELDRIFSYEYPTISHREQTLDSLKCEFLIDQC